MVEIKGFKPMAITDTVARYVFLGKSLSSIHEISFCDVAW